MTLESATKDCLNTSMTASTNLRHSCIGSPPLTAGIAVKDLLFVQEA